MWGGQGPYKDCKATDDDDYEEEDDDDGRFIAVFTKTLPLALICVLSQIKLVHAIEPTSYFFNSSSPSGK
jgi:hypothetical protein